MRGAPGVLHRGAGVAAGELTLGAARGDGRVSDARTVLDMPPCVLFTAGVFKRQGGALGR